MTNKCIQCNQPQKYLRKGRPCNICKNGNMSLAKILHETVQQKYLRKDRPCNICKNGNMSLNYMNSTAEISEKRQAL